MPHQLYREIQLCTGGATGFTFASFVQLLSFQSLGSAITFLGTVGFTAFSWYLSHRAEVLKIEREAVAAKLAFERDQQYQDLLNQIRMERARHDAGLDVAHVAHVPPEVK